MWVWGRSLWPAGYLLWMSHTTGSQRYVELTRHSEQAVDVMIGTHNIYSSSSLCTFTWNVAFWRDNYFFNINLVYITYTLFYKTCFLNVTTSQVYKGMIVFIWWTMNFEMFNDSLKKLTIFEHLWSNWFFQFIYIYSI